MSSSVKKIPVGTEQKTTPVSGARDVWQPFDTLRQQVDSLFEDFSRGSLLAPLGRGLGLFDREALWPREMIGRNMPAVDIAEKEKSYEVTAELPGMDEKNIEIKLSDTRLIIRGEKKEDKEEKYQGYHLSERSYGSFERVFNLPKGVDLDKIDARFSKGVLTVSLPKKAEAIKPEKIVQIKAS